MPVLADFAEALELPEPTGIVADPGRYLGPVSEFMRDQTVTCEDRNWTLTRIGYLIGELLVQRFGGCWFINEIHGSGYFLRYCVGRFSRVKNQDAMVDPFEIADSFLAEPVGRDLLRLLAEVDAEIRAA